VLARNNKDIEPMSRRSRRRGVQFIVESSQNVFQDLTIRKLITLFYAIYRLGSDKELIEAMHIDIFGSRR
jgi:ATP-dependent exoDNAse (exonuclease V) beta subunit